MATITEPIKMPPMYSSDHNRYYVRFTTIPELYVAIYMTLSTLSDLDVVVIAFRNFAFSVEALKEITKGYTGVKKGDYKGSLYADSGYGNKNYQLVFMKQ